MKPFPVVVFIFGLASLATAQYGIPDDDDEPSSYTLPLAPAPAQEPLRFEVVKEESLYAPQAPARLEASPQYDFKYAVRTPVHVEPIRVEIAKDLRSEVYDAPVVIQEAPVSSYDSVVVREEVPSYVTPSVRFEDSYANQPVYSSRREPVPIVKYVMNNDNYGTFNLEAVSGDGTTEVKSGQLKDLGGEEGPIAVMSGSYSFNGDDGKTYRVDWVADERGFVANGEHLPTTPAPFH